VAENRQENRLVNPGARIFKWTANNSPSPRRRVALLGIAQRQISIKFTHKLRKENHAKPLPESIQTLADWIQVKRHEKNLTSSHLAVKMGIASTLVRSWESGTSQPNDRQLKVLTDFFGTRPSFLTDCG
jgi:ribosome-binding protein aMBF1 (putative translation factor)